jgi:cation diffusion facilitator family transporter
VRSGKEEPKKERQLHTHDPSDPNEHHEHDEQHDHLHPHEEHAERWHEQDHTHAHEHERDHDHGRSHGSFGWLIEAIPFLHGHSHGEVNVDAALESSARGIWALKISLLLLGGTALFQLVIVLISGSVGLLADTIHNFGDALTAVPLWIAFVVGRRAATRRYTYGYGRAEDIAGVLIVGLIFVSAIIAAYESVQKLFHPQPLGNIGWVMAAAVIGFLGNEAVAQFRIRVGREIGSAALIADGQHARVDGFTSLAVLVGALGVLLGFPLADPIVGLLITIAILFIVKDTARTMWRRLMDAVEPEVVDTIERTAAAVPGVEDVHDVRARWLGHTLGAELHATVDETLPTRASHAIAEEVRHHLFHTFPRLSLITVHVDPCGHSGDDPHHRTAHHRATTT